MCQFQHSAVRSQTTGTKALERQKPGPSVDGGNPRNLIQRLLGRSVSVCSTRTDGRGAEHFEGHQKKQESSRRVLSSFTRSPAEQETERFCLKEKRDK